MADADGRIQLQPLDQPGDPPASALSAWERVLLARHPLRPYTLDYVRLCCSDFVELHGDRLFGDDPAIVGGLASLAGETVMLIGHQKGRGTKENVVRHFGMARPEGYRKALRLMRHAERLGLPVVTLVDIPGADPSLQSEERGQALAIAENLEAMAHLRTPILATIIGEGGSGGALAIGMGDRVLMLEHAIYSVASPEAAASILWRDAARAPEAAEAMKITAEHQLHFGVVDAVIPEPPGGAHADPPAAAAAVREALCEHLRDLRRRYARAEGWDLDALLEARYQKYRRLGVLGA
ncbi:MAG: acetyl-CoA carboxylase carboxyltransferase subunit alpha [Chloroflexi bacterium]|nr:acetyl-CoA carboxylase carboxyltransferase subunit alpha [Chloroflexota bacterium]